MWSIWCSCHEKHQWAAKLHLFSPNVLALWPLNAQLRNIKNIAFGKINSWIWQSEGIDTSKEFKPFSHTLRKFICKTFKSEPLLLDFHIKRTLILSAHWSLLKFIETLSRASKGSFMDVHFLAFLALFFSFPPFLQDWSLQDLILRLWCYSVVFFLPPVSTSPPPEQRATTRPHNPPTFQPSGPTPRKSTPKTCM